MSVDWAGVADEAAAAIDEVGFAATLLRPGVNTGSESNPVIGEPISQPVTVLKLSLDRLRKSGSLVEGTKSAYLIAADGLTEAPTTLDKLSVGGDAKTILAASEIGPGGVDLLYTVQVA